MMKMPEFLVGTEQPPTPATAREGLPRRIVKTTLSHTSTRVLVTEQDACDTSTPMAQSVSVSSLSCTVQMEIIGDASAAVRPSSLAPGGGSAGGGDLLLGEDESLGHDTAGVANDRGERAAGAEVIVGSSDRAPHLALKYAQVSVRLHPPRAVAPPLIAAGAALSPSQRQRRCLQSGFCDPASPLGCGGQYCDFLPDF
ncbi:hypothetical protein [Herbaspirillum rubrisubalbicans]|uniref:hypothetical protein n=1 Tax=Herbaspirillum rubrisubalbicans TaxID=80842 RepID=UPI0003198097|nr:hypothetical protein [Herbaspirillum rubrisubalbicans]